MKITTAIFLIASTLLALGCGQKAGFQNSQESVLGGGGNGSGGSDTDKQAWNEIASQMSGQLSGSAYDKAQVLGVNVDKQSVVFLLPFPAFLLPVASKGIVDLPGASIETVKDANGKDVWAVTIPIKYLIKGAKLQQFNKLPNGDALPMFPAGEVQGISIQFPDRPKYRVNLYLGVSAAAVFVESPLIDLPADIFDFIPPYEIRNKEKTQILGYFKVIPQKNNFLGGIYVSTRIPAALARQLNDLIKF